MEDPYVENSYVENYESSVYSSGGSVYSDDSDDTVYGGDIIGFGEGSILGGDIGFGDLIEPGASGLDDIMGGDDKIPLGNNDTISPRDKDDKIISPRDKDEEESPLIVEDSDDDTLSIDSDGESPLVEDTPPDTEEINGGSTLNKALEELFNDVNI